MKQTAPKDPNRILNEDSPAIDEAVRQGVREALLRHKARGNPVVIERNGEIVWIRPEDLPNE